MDKEPLADLSWMRIAAASKPVPEWAGDLTDDCSSRWAGFILRAEAMDDADWWWAVYLEGSEMQIASSRDAEAVFTSGEDARAAAFKAAYSFLYPHEPMA